MLFGALRGLGGNDLNPLHLAFEEASHCFFSLCGMSVVYKKVSTAETHQPASQTMLEGSGILETAFLSRGFYSQTRQQTTYAN